MLGPHQAEAELKRILPEQIARFFLFDGELLQEYEDLLSTETDMGRRISEAIERILGVPVLTSARATLLGLKDKSEYREARAAQGDQKTREFGNQLADLHAQRETLQKDLHRLEADLEAMRSQKASLEDAMKRKDRVAALLDKRDHLDRLLTEIDARRSAKDVGPSAGDVRCLVRGASCADSGRRDESSRQRAGSSDGTNAGGCPSWLAG